MPTANDRKRAEIASCLIAMGCVKDKWGHYILERTNEGVTVKYRYVLNPNVIRFEKQAFIGDKNEWLRIQSYRISMIKIENGKMTIPKSAITR